MLVVVLECASVLFALFFLSSLCSTHFCLIFFLYFCTVGRLFFFHAVPKRVERLNLFEHLFVLIWFPKQVQSFHLFLYFTVCCNISVYIYLYIVCTSYIQRNVRFINVSKNKSWLKNSLRYLETHWWFAKEKLFCITDMGKIINWNELDQQ